MLIRAALDAARERGMGVLPHCPFVRSFIERHPEYLELVPPLRRRQFGLHGSGLRATTSESRRTALRDQLIKQEIRDAHSRYCRAMDRRDEALAASIWHEDGTADYGDIFKGTGAGFAAWVTETHVNFDRHSHQINNVLVEVGSSGEQAVSEAYVTVALWTLAGRHGRGDPGDLAGPLPRPLGAAATAAGALPPGTTSRTSPPRSSWPPTRSTRRARRAGVTPTTRRTQLFSSLS